MGDETKTAGQSEPETTQGPTTQEKDLQLRDFLLTVPALEWRRVKVDQRLENTRVEVRCPTIELYCESPLCDGERLAAPTPSSLGLGFATRLNDADSHFVTYHCRNCGKRTKTFALTHRGFKKYTQPHLELMKYGEDPRLGEPRRDLITKALDDEIEYFDRGYRAEMQGLGIGAFAYYRRFVDSHKDKIIDEIRKVADAHGAKPEVFAALDRAKKTDSFKRAVEEIDEAIPESFRIAGGVNPLTLLYSALSVGVHADDDVECLQRAHDIRIVLTDLTERTAALLSNKDELREAVKRLAARPKKDK